MEGKRAGKESGAGVGVGVGESSVGSCTGSCWEKAEEKKALKEAKSKKEKEKEKSFRRRVFLVRNGERLDRMFPAVWQGRGEVGQGLEGRLCLDDVNLPHRLPLSLAQDDPPLTPFGEWTSALVGESLVMAGLRPPFVAIYSSPSLRSLQTASAIAAVLAKASNQPIPLINVEPGLCTQRPSLPLSPGALAQMGIRVNPRYQPFLQNPRQKEWSKMDDWVEPMWDRLLRETGEKEVVAVSDGLGVEMGAGAMSGVGGKLSGGDLAVAHPPASVTVLEGRRRGSFRFLPNYLQHFSYLHTSNRVNNSSLLA